MTDWQTRAAVMVEMITRSGELRTPLWQRAFRVVPRHCFVPVYYTCDEDGNWRAHTNGQTGWLDGVYDDRTLITALAEDHGPCGVQQIPVSSSTTPALMAHMLEELDITPGMRVLEIGTGTGYHAGVLCAALGQDNVFSIELRPELVALARTRLAELGYHPVLRAADGSDGLAEHAPYDRIIATCAVSAIPAAWISQLAPGGVLLTDLKGGLSAGNLVKLCPDCSGAASGRFLSWWAGFMPMRHEQHIAAVPVPRGDASIHRATTVPPSVLDEPVFAFLAQLHLPAGTSLRLRGGDDGSLSTVLVAPDGSWCQVVHKPDGHGEHQVAETELQPWSAVEEAAELWETLQPSWDNFGLTANTDGRQWVSVNSPEREHTFSLEPVP